MNSGEIKTYLEEKRRQGLDEVGCWQVRIAANMGISKEKLDLLAVSGLSFTNREWLYIALAEQIPAEWLTGLSELTAGGIWEVRQRYFRQEYGVDSSLETELGELKEQVEKQMKESSLLCGFLSQWKENKEDFQKAVEEKEKEAADLQMENEMLRSELKKLQAQIKTVSPVNKCPSQTKKSLSPWGKRIFGAFYRKREQKEAEELIALLKEKNFSKEQKEYLLSCREAGDPIEVIRKIAYESFQIEEMERIRKLLV